MLINRSLVRQIEQLLFKGKAVIILGARQVGKTTLVKQITDKLGKQVAWFDAEEPDVKPLLENKNSQQLKLLFKNAEIVVIDEAQKLTNPGSIIKIIVDHIPQVQVIATGSSSFDLTNKIYEPLTGRAWEFVLPPVSFAEMSENTSVLDEIKNLEQRLIYGYYPEVVVKPDLAKEILKTISTNYLYKDILMWEGIRKPTKIQTLVQALAYQIGNMVSYSELSKMTGLDVKTVEKYLDLLEKSYVVFRLGSFSRNLRSELTKAKKYYFWDLGIRNSVIGNFEPLAKRTDVGQLWENFFIAEKMKNILNRKSDVRLYFWRTHQQKEIDLIEESQSELNVYEIKWNVHKSVKMPKNFSEAYPKAQFNLVNPDNFYEFLLET
jgi:hypothetical protein